MLLYDYGTVEKSDALKFALDGPEQVRLPPTQICYQQLHIVRDHEG